MNNLDLQLSSGQVEVQVVLNRGGLWGQGLTIFEFESYGPGRSDTNTYCVVFMPGNEAAPSENRVGQDPKVDSNGHLIKLDEWFRLEIVVGHHEGSTTLTLKELKEYFEVDKHNDWYDHRTVKGMEQAIAVVEKLVSLMCTNPQLGSTVTISVPPAQ